MSTTYDDLFLTALEESAGPSWLPVRRQEAFTRFQTLGFPTTRNEDWHFTSVTPIAEQVFRPVRAEGAIPSLSALEPFLVDPSWHRLVFVNGRYESALSAPGTLPAGVKVGTLLDTLKARPDWVRERLGQLAADDTQAFTALNTAFVGDGAVVEIGADAVLDAPIHLLFVTDDRAAGGATWPRVLVVAGDRSQGAVVESHVGLGRARSFTNAVTEVWVGNGTRLDHYKLQQEGSEALHVGTLQATQGRDSVFHAFSYASGAALSRSNVYTRMPEPGAEARLNGLYVIDGTQHADHQTFVEHIAPNCASREVYKGVLDGDSHGVFNGKVFVAPEAQKTDGKQSNHALLLGEHARVDSKPQLEIFADDVKCTHGATVGRLEELPFFYLKSRGIGGEKARALLTYAFAAEVLERIECDPLRLHLEELVFERFTHQHQRDA